MSQNFTEIGGRLVKKWERLLEGIEGTNKQLTTAILLENESQKGGALLEDTQSGQSAGGATFGQQVGNQANVAPFDAGNNIAPFQHYLLPLVRRVYPNLIANELVGVQPMTSPASLVFYLKYRYTGLVDGTTDIGVAKGETQPGTEYGNFIGNTWNIDPYYSLQTIWREDHVSDIGGTITTGTGAVADLVPDVTPVIPGTATITYTATLNSGAVVQLSFKEGEQAGRNFSTISGTPVNTDNGTVASALAFNSVDVNYDMAAVVIASDAVVSIDTAVLTYDYNMEGNRNLPEIELQVESQPVTAKTRKLRTKWTSK